MGISAVSYCRLSDNLSFRETATLERLLEQIRSTALEIVKATEEDAAAPRRLSPELCVGGSGLSYWRLHFTAYQDSRTRLTPPRPGVGINGLDPVPYFGEAEAFTLSLDAAGSSLAFMRYFNQALLGSGLVSQIAFVEFDAVDKTIWINASEPTIGAVLIEPQPIWRRETSQVDEDGKPLEWFEWQGKRWGGDSGNPDLESQCPYPNCASIGLKPSSDGGKFYWRLDMGAAALTSFANNQQ